METEMTCPYWTIGLHEPDCDCRGRAITFGQQEPEVVVLEDRMVPCGACEGNGWYEWSAMGADNTDIDWGIQDPCDLCGGTGFDDIEVVEVAA